MTFVLSTCGLLLFPPHNFHHRETTVFLNDVVLLKKRTNVHHLLSNVFCKEKTLGVYNRRTIAEEQFQI